MAHQSQIGTIPKYFDGKICGRFDLRILDKIHPEISTRKSINQHKKTRFYSKVTNDKSSRSIDATHMLDTNPSGTQQRQITTRPQAFPISAPPLSRELASKSFRILVVAVKSSVIAKKLNISMKAPIYDQEQLIFSVRQIFSHPSLFPFLRAIRQMTCRTQREHV